MPHAGCYDPCVLGRLLLPSLFACLLSSAHILGQAPELSFARDVQPILAENCLVCHGADPSTREADLRFDSREGMLMDLGGYSPVLPGKPEESEIIRRILAEDPEDRMPPADHGDALSDAQVEVLRRWIAAGAEWQEHWAYLPLGAITLPAPEDEPWQRNPIDRFVLARLRSLGLAPSPEAGRAKLLRRLALDLTGLAPTPAELSAFLADDRPDAYERMVDRYLASSAFAPRWARHWLDLARYADSHGFTIDGGRSIWPWRDWVVDAIDADMPFDQFTIEQLAGDLLPDPTRAQRIATGFHRNTQVNQEGGAKDEENRVNAVIDRVNTTGAVWMGTTLACAQCHTHKFDPISHEEYFQLFAFYNQTRDAGVSPEPSILVPSNASEAAAVLEWETTLASLEQEYAAARDAAAESWQTWQPARAWGSNGPELRPEEDGSYRVVGQNAVYSTYVLQGQGAADGLSSLRLEAIPFGNRGPGRAGRGNFVLQHLRLFVRPYSPGRADEDADAPWQRLAFSTARADFEQASSAQDDDVYTVASAIAAEPGRGWAISPAFGRPHAAEFELAEALAPGAWELRLELQQEYGNNHCLGAFRVALQTAVSDENHALVPAAWSEAWQRLRVHRDSKPNMASSLVLAARSKARKTQLFHRGSFLDPRQEVSPGFPAALNHFDRQSQPKDRLDLAAWLVHPENALVMRVTVNRWWQQLFGRGLVATENDFGLRGAWPSHPMLLEWLAAELPRRGFSRKAMLRLMLTSATYRQDSILSDAQLEVDPDNLLLGRQGRLRLEGEVLRDLALQLSGLLDDRRGGPPVQPPQPEGVFAFTQSQRQWQVSQGGDRFRRSIYTRLWRSSPYPFYAIFDTPAANVACTRRATSNTALQALAMANDAMLMELAAGFGGRIQAEYPGADDAERLQAAMMLALSRAPRPAEAELMLAHLSRVRSDRGETAAWTALARLIFNLDEFLTRS